MSRFAPRKVYMILITFAFIFVMCAVLGSNVVSGNTTVHFSPSKENKTYEFDMKAETISGIHFNAEGSFDYIEIYMVVGDSRAQLEVELYKWEKGFRTSRKGEKLAETTIKKYTKDKYMKIQFDKEISSGEYLLCIDNLATKNATARKYINKKGNTAIYQDGFIVSGNIDAQINFTGGNAVLGPIQEDTEGMQTAGPEPELPSDSPVYTMDVRPDTWTATDGLGRTLDTYAEVGGIKDNKTVGIFYWTWHEELGKSTTMIRNNTKIMEEFPEAIYDFKHKAWKNFKGYHFWDEPLFGYYISTDEYVLRKHAEMFADAGIDVVVFDNTNGIYSWENAYMTLLKVFSEARQEGVNVPKVAFMLNFGHMGNTRTLVYDLYDNLYRKGLYQDLWFYWDGKPLMWAFPEAFNGISAKNEEILNFFTFRKPAASEENTPGEWGWITNYPPVPRYDYDGNFEQMAVGVAQRIGAMNSTESVGRGYSNTGKYDEKWQPGWLYGIHFQEMFDAAIEADPEFLFITGWNEWVAMRHEEWGGTANAFPDQFDYLRSRDAEPSKGVLRDNYYYVLTNNIRRYKGVSKPELQKANKTIDIAGELSQWDSGVAVFNHYIGSTKARNSKGYANMHYKSDTMRNDIVTSKVAYDKDNIYFYVDTVNPITPSDGNAWMRLLIDTDTTGNSMHWEGFEFMLNRVNPTDSTCTLEKSLGVGEKVTDWKWEKVADVPYRVQNNVLVLSIPRNILGLTDDEISFNFKWSDNMQTEGEILDFYLSGDVAPGGRFMFHFTTEEIVYKGENTFNWLWVAVISSGAAVVVAAIIILIIMKNKKKKQLQLKTDNNII